MRWNSLFDDLEVQLEHELGAEDGQLRAEEERLRLGRLSLRGRLVALATPPGALGGASDASITAGVRLLRIELRSGAMVVLQAQTFGKDWVAGDLIAAGQRQPQCVIPLAAIAGVLLDRASIERSLVEPGAASMRMADRIGLSFVLRDLCRRRAFVEIDSGGFREEGRNRAVHGTIDRVGRDHCDVAMHEPGTPRRESYVTGYRIVPFEQIMMLRVHD